MDKYDVIQAEMLLKESQTLIQLLKAGKHQEAKQYKSSMMTRLKGMVDTDLIYIGKGDG